MSTEIEITDAMRARALEVAFRKAEAHCKVSERSKFLSLKERAEQLLKLAHHAKLEPRLYELAYFVNATMPG